MKDLRYCEKCGRYIGIPTDLYSVRLCTTCLCFGEPQGTSATNSSSDPMPEERNTEGNE